MNRNISTAGHKNAQRLKSRANSEEYKMERQGGNSAYIEQCCSQARPPLQLSDQPKSITRFHSNEL